jgi:F-box and WD-40 domain protein CDC4
VRVWDLSVGVCVRVSTGHRDSIWSLAVLPDGSLVSGSGDHSVRVWDSGGDCLHTLKHKSSVYQLVVLPDGRLASCSADQTVRIWDGASCVHVLQHQSRVVDLKMANGLLISACADGTVCAWQ